MTDIDITKRIKGSQGSLFYFEALAVLAKMCKIFYGQCGSALVPLKLSPSAKVILKNHSF